MERTTPQEELAWIRGLMADSQAYLYGTWKHQFLWGFLASVGLATTWFAAETGAHARIFWVWGAVIVLGWATSLYLMSREGATATVRNAAGRAYAGIWTGLGVTVTLLGLITMTTGAIPPALLPGLFALTFGGGYFASGFLAGLRWMQGVGVAWWVSGVVLCIWSSPDALLALAGLALLLEMGPAIVLQQMERAGEVGR